MSEGLLRIAVRVPIEHAEEARARAFELAPGGFEEAEAEGGLTLVFYATAEAAEAIEAAFPGAGTTPVDPGWEDRWRSFHRPARAGGLWIGPPWEHPEPGEPTVVIDPGRAFGTGAHPTTRLCVELLARAERGSLLDVGCGSGILSIAAARLGFGPIASVDIDPIAVETTIANAAANRVAVDASVLDGEEDELPHADVAVANVLLAPVERILARLDAAVAITSGYLVGDVPSAPRWAQVDRVTLDGWAADRFVRVDVNTR
jgi:ribosomal protein L11 methyltransferase